jgi:hypothetical protein
VRGDDKFSSRGPDGSPSDRGHGIVSRSAPASADDKLLAILRDAVRELEANGGRVGHELLCNLALSKIGPAIRRWRAENPPTRFVAPQMGRPAALEDDIALLRDIFAAYPNSDGRREFALALAVKEPTITKRQIQIRYRRAYDAIIKGKE